jgi:hypothetical protein
MEKGSFQLLHFFGHGLSRNGVSALMLENEQGRVHPVEEKLLAEVFLGVRELRLVTLVACHGGAPSSGDPFSGLAGRLVQRGVPSVIAMRRAVRVDSAHLFTQHLYRHIAQTGRADAAVNEARQQLYLAEPRGIDWSSPVLYSRLSDGRLWLPRTAAPEPDAERGPLLRFSFHRLRNPLVWLPALLALVLCLLGVWPVPEAEARLELNVSRLSFRLAETATVLERLDLAELAAARLADLRLPVSLSPESLPRPGTATGFLLATRGSGAHITLHTPPLPPGTTVGLEQDEGKDFRITIGKSDQALRVTFQGDVLFKPLTAPAVPLHAEHSDALVLTPLSGAAEIDVTFARFAPDSFSRDIRIDHLDLFKVIDQQTATASLVRREPTILAGEVRMPATGRRIALTKGEALRYASLAGSLTDLRVGDDGIRLGFQGRVSRLERVPAGLRPESLMPSVLDLRLARRTRIAVQAGAGLLAIAVLLLSILDSGKKGD